MSYALSATFDLNGNYIKEMAKAQAQTKSMNSSLTTASGGFGKITGAAMKAGAYIGLGLGLKELITTAYKFAESASNLAEANNVVETTFKSSGKSIEAWTNTTSTSAGIGKTNATQWVGFMGAMLKSSGLGEQASGTMSKSLVQLTGDMSSFYNIDTKDMWEKLRSGISGETEPLKQIGINMSVANLQAYALAEGMKKPYKAMTQGEQTTLRYNYLMKVTKDAQNDFSKTLGTSFANQVRVAKLNLDSMSASLGTKLLPYFMQLVSYVNKNMPKIQSIITSAMKGVTAAVQFVLPKFQTMITLVGQIAQSILPSFGSASDNAKTKASDFAKGGIELVIKALTWIRDNMGVVKLAIAGVTTVWAIQSGIAVINNTALAINNGLLAISAVKSGAETVAIVALYIAQGIATGATKAAALAQIAFNLAMSLNPIGIVIIALTALGVAIYEVVKHWQEICTWISKAWDWLTKWNGTPATDKNATVTTNYLEKGSTAGAMGNGIMGKAKGDKNWMGGPVLTQESGGEIIDLPSHTRIIPHDVSMKLAETAGKSSKTIAGHTFIFNITGNVGSKEFFDKTADEMSNRVLTQLANM